MNIPKYKENKVSNNYDVIIIGSGISGLCSAALLSMEGKKVFRRQDAKKFFDVTTVCYVVDPKFVLEHSHLLDGKILMHYVPPERSIDIDNQLDFEIAEFLFNRDKSN